MSCSWEPAAPDLSAGKRSAPGAALRGPAHRATDRSPHEKHASTDHRGSQRVADRRSAPGSNTVPSDGPFAVRDAARASRPADPQHFPSGRCTDPEAGPAHSGATAGSQPASPVSVVGRDGQHASGRSRLDTQAGRCRSQHCVAAPWRSSTAHDRADARSRAPPNHQRAGPRSPPAQRRTDNAQTPARG